MRPLEGIRVIDLTHVLAGPFSTHQLCMLGADVIKIEKPGQGDQTRGLALQPELNGLAPGFVALNSGKRSVVVDLKTDEGRRRRRKAGGHGRRVRRELSSGQGGQAWTDA